MALHQKWAKVQLPQKAHWGPQKITSFAAIMLKSIHYFQSTGRETDVQTYTHTYWWTVRTEYNLSPTPLEGDMKIYQLVEASNCYNRELDAFNHPFITEWNDFNTDCFQPHWLVNTIWRSHHMTSVAHMVGHDQVFGIQSSKFQLRFKFPPQIFHKSCTQNYWIAGSWIYSFSSDTSQYSSSEKVTWIRNSLFKMNKHKHQKNAAVTTAL